MLDAVSAMSGEAARRDALLERTLDRLTSIEEALAVKDVQIAELRHKLDWLVAQARQREIDALDDEWPDWREIVGAPDDNAERPDLNTPFRKWITTKSAAYQARINGSFSAEVVGEAIRLFQNEQKQRKTPE